MMSDPSLIGPRDNASLAVPQKGGRVGLRVALLNRVIHAACRLAPLIIPRLPRFVVLALIGLLGNLAYFCMGRRRWRIALANLAVAFGDALPMQAKRTLIRRSMCNLVRVVVDLIWFSHDRERRIQKYVWFDSSCDEYFAQHPAIGVSAHFGNWEVLNQGLAILRSIPLAIPYAPPHDTVVRRLLEQLRSGTQTLFVPRTGSDNALWIWKALRDEKRTVAMLLDQNELPTRDGGFVQFFGLPVPAPLGAARLALASGLPIVAVFCVPDGRGRYRISARAPDLSSNAPDPQADATFVTQRIMDVIEDEIRSRPELWLWTHRRWNYIPFGKASFSKYPFYAQKVIVPRDLIPRELRRARAARSSAGRDIPRKVA
jgi:Kdo2-lipid IVA lauroyltransferase/acyltransferase